MDGALSQDEINALLTGMTPDDSDGGGTAGTDGGPGTKDSVLSDKEKDAIGEVANITMGSSATTLFSLVNHKVNITTPQVEVSDWKGVAEHYERPCVFITIKYTMGVDGTNVLILKEHDVMVITDLMMGGDGTNTEGTIGELQLSAISEAMNQMMGAAATSLSTMTGQKVDISPPHATLESFLDEDPSKFSSFLTEDFVKISFRMEIDGLVDSTLMQLYPIDFAKSLYDTLIMDTSSSKTNPSTTPVSQPQNTSVPPQSSPGMTAPSMAAPGMTATPVQQPMNVQPAQFQSFSADAIQVPGAENIGLISDVPLDVTVELGRTIKPISDILNFAPGTIIELDKIAGEPVDVLVNGKYVARGEVVVIEESFGVRVTEIIK